MAQRNNLLACHCCGHMSTCSGVVVAHPKSVWFVSGYFEGDTGGPFLQMSCAYVHFSPALSTPPFLLSPFLPPAGRGSLIRSVSAWHASSPEFDPDVRHILSWRLGHGNTSTAILPLPLIQEEQLSVTG